MIRGSVMSMFVVLSGLVILSELCAAEYSVRCSDHGVDNTTLTASEDGVKGRYVLEWCTDINANDTEWGIMLGYNRRRLNSCSFRNQHSFIKEPLNHKLLNCSHVCLSRNLDLLFSACYMVHNWFPGRGSMKIITPWNITNEYTVNMFASNVIRGTTVNHEDYVSAHFYMGNIPVTDYTVELCKVNSTHHEHQNCHSIYDKCRQDLYEIVCKLWGLEGSYSIRLQHRAPWVGSDFAFDKKDSILFFQALSGSGTLRRVESARGGGAALAWASGALGALVAAALLLLLALRWRRGVLARKHVLQHWLHRAENKIASPVSAPVGPILLLYARECAAAEPVIAALKALLETLAPDQVYDVYSAGTLALAAAGGSEWVRALLARVDTRVVLLQTPALEALHTRRLPADPQQTPKLEQPLLCSRVVYRAPAPGDWLLQFALRLLADTAHQPPGDAQPYRKYYLARLEGLETEALPYAVPFRRYVLPVHAAALLRDLAPHQPTPAAAAPPPAAIEGPPDKTPAPPPVDALQRHLADTLAHAAVGFLDYVRANPDYLMEELLLL